MCSSLVPSALAHLRSEFRHCKLNVTNQSGKRDSNPRPQPWQGCALPTELFPHNCTLLSEDDSERSKLIITRQSWHPSEAEHRRGAWVLRLLLLRSLATTRRIHGGERDRTADLLNAIQALSQLSYAPSSQPMLAKHVTAFGQEPRSIAKGIPSVNELGLAQISSAGILQRYPVLAKGFSVEAIWVDRTMTLAYRLVRDTSRSDAVVP